MKELKNKVAYFIFSVKSVIIFTVLVMLAPIENFIFHTDILINSAFIYLITVVFMLLIACTITIIEIIREED